LDGKGKIEMEVRKMTSEHLAKMIERCFLKWSPKEKATKQEQTLALECFKALADECKDIQLYLEALLYLAKKAKPVNVSTI